MTRSRSLEFSSAEPSQKDDILVTGIMYNLENLIGLKKGYGSGHVLLTFIAGVTLTLAALGITTRFLHGSIRDQSVAVEEFHAIQSGAE